jgi:hypothetical protein
MVVGLIENGRDFVQLEENDEGNRGERSEYEDEERAHEII